MRLLLHALVVCTAALVAGGAPPVFAQESAGGYTTRVGGQTFGTESYKINRNEDGSRRAEADAAFGGMKLKVLTAIRADGSPASFEMEVNGAKALKQEFTAAGVRVTAAGQPEKTVEARPDVLLENGVWHHFVFLFARYDARRGGAQTFAAMLPSQALPFKLTVEPVGRESFDVKGQKITTEHFRAQTDLGLAIEVWTDESRATPLLLAVPAQSLQAVRHGSEDLAAVVFARDAPPAPSASDPYTTEEVTFRNGEQQLAGTLTIPKGAQGPHPAAVLITGSGGQDRDGTGLANIYRRIAERLSANGERDALVMPHHALALARALAESGNKRVTVRIFRDLTHLFTPASGGERAGEVSEEFLRALQEWASGALAKK